MTDYLGSAVDLFSGGGGMSYGFFAHPMFSMVAAADAEIGKPSTGAGAIGCNTTYEANIKVAPLAADLSAVAPEDVLAAWNLPLADSPRVLLACPPCTGFSQANPKNMVEDDPRNSLVAHVADYADSLSPDLIFMENVPQLLNGRFKGHFAALKGRLESSGYDVRAEVHVLSSFGLAQQRSRALVVAAKKGYQVRTLSDLWDGYRVNAEATTVRRAIAHLPELGAGQTDTNDPSHTCGVVGEESLARLRAIPHDGGSWPDLLRSEETKKHLIPSMWRSVEKGRLNSYMDVYGRMSWDRPAPTVKRECSHTGNGRYAHPEQDRLCSVREMGNLQGFPDTYRFVGDSRKNLYRQIGDAVPPLISYQLAWVASWILTGRKPDLEQAILPNTNLTASDLVRVERQDVIAFC